MSFLQEISTMSYVAIGAVAMFILGALMRRYNQFNIFILALNTVLLTVSGVFGTMVLYFIKTGEWGGLSYYGAVLFIPVFMSAYALVTKQNVKNMLDFSAYGSCAMLTIMKVDCFVYGCCYGRTFTTSGFTFPSRIMEGINAFVIMVVLLLLLKNAKNRGKIYPIYFIIYGCTRFIFNCFRGDLTAFLWIIPSGHFWSIISIVLGIIWLVVLKNKEEKLPENQLAKSKK